MLGVVGGCKKAAPEAPQVVDFAVPTAISTLSVFEPVGANCEWRQVDPAAGTTVLLASLPGTCMGARVGWSPDSSKAVVWFDPTHVQRAGYSSQVSSKSDYPDEVPDAKAPLRAFVVSTRKPRVEPLPIPAMPGHTLQTLGVNGSARSARPTAAHNCRGDPGARIHSRGW